MKTQTFRSFLHTLTKNPARNSTLCRCNPVSYLTSCLAFPLCRIFCKPKNQEIVFFTAGSLGPDVFQPVPGGNQHGLAVTIFSKFGA